MKRPRLVQVFGGVSLLLVSGLLVSRADDQSTATDSSQFTVSHAECSFFGPDREKFAAGVLNATTGQMTRRHPLSDATEAVRQLMAFVPPGGPTYGYDQTHQAGSIDSYIFADFKANGITPAPNTTDWEFIRRVTLDLTGRIPDPARVLVFVADTTPDKRAKLVDELLAKPEWIDKWTMFFGDLYQNTTTKSSGLNRYPQGRNAFYQWIHDSLANGKPYNQMATELITAATGTDTTYSNGPSNWMLNGYITGGPSQDLMDQSTAFVFDTFLGIAHVNCVLCHNGRGHLDQLSLWGSATTRYQGWQLAAFVSHTQINRITDTTYPNGTYWTLLDNVKGYTTDYTLNTTTGNRPPRVAPTGCKSGQPCYYVPPQYIFNGNSPMPGENYRTALARNVTNDFQFARATVNYIWAQLFGMGIVDPPDTFDPARLDPNNPPPAPWTLQPTNAALLNAMATRFVQGGYNVKSLMRDIANSQTYQLSTRYNGTWNAAWEPYFARKFVRRLWSEELHDAVAQSSGTLPSYTMTGFTDQGYPKFSYAMQAPDVVGGTNDGNANNLLDAFLRGNRDDQPRKEDGSILQALSLMNNPFVEARLQSTGATPSQLIVKNMGLDNTSLTNTLYLSILSRYPASDELSKSVAALSGGSNRTQAIQDLVWSLYNKVDFVFNY